MDHAQTIEENALWWIVRKTIINILLLATTVARAQQLLGVLESRMPTKHATEPPEMREASARPEAPEVISRLSRAAFGGCGPSFPNASK